MKLIRFLCAAMLCAGPAQAADIRTVPAGDVIVYPADPRHGYADLMLQTILVQNDQPGVMTVESLQIELLRDGRVLEQRWLDLDAAAQGSAEMASMGEQGMGVFNDLQMLDKNGLAGVLGEGARFASSRALATRETLVATRQYFAVAGVPDQVRISARGSDATGKPVEASTVLQARMHEGFAYGFPLAGNWIMRALPMMQGHHRWIASSEFARDWFKVGDDGAGTVGDEALAENNLGYGQPVMAAADGEVVYVIADQVQDRAALMQQPGETEEAAGARIGNYNMQRYMEDFPSAAAGNLVVLKHEQQGRTEYTAYGHLKSGSVKVNVGDIVTRGEVIAEVGDTGDSSAVHLHFQVNAGPDPFYSRSLPFEFDNMESLFIGQDPGLLVGPSKVRAPTRQEAR